jgi:quercetin dioxygenase-like cupin family protein
MPYSGTMLTRRILLGSAGALLTPLLSAQNGRGNVKTVFEHDLPDLTLQDWSANAVEVSYWPGESSSAHRHPGITIAYVLEGEIRSKVGDGPERTYTAGQMFIEMPRELHAVSANASATKPAKLLAILLAKKGQALTTPA